MRQLYTSFEYLNRELLRLSGHPASVYGTAGVGVMRLIAFAYLYHYLNWFSKTSIIKWHEISRSRAAVIGGVWLAGGLAYLYDYRLGFGIHQTLVEIGKSLGAGRWRTVGSERGLSAG